MKNLIIKTTALFVVLVIVVLPIYSIASDKTTVINYISTDVTLQLKWKHQFQFAGYYAALEKGYYKEAGLNVTFLEAGEGINSADEVIKGKADFGIAMSDLISLRAKGNPVVALASIYQHSPLVLLSSKSSGIDNIHSLLGKRIALEDHAEELLAYFESEGVRTSKMIIFPHEYGTSNLISGEVDAISAYSTDEPFMLLREGIKYNTLSPRSGGIDFYGDTLFTTELQIKENPEKVRLFTEASLKGWRYAIEHSEEIIDLILSKYTKRHTREHLQFEAKMSKRLIMADVVEIGYINKGRWDHISDIFKKLHKIPEEFSLDGFIYDKNSKPDYSPFYFGLTLLFVISLTAVFSTARFYRINRTLKKEITKRREVEIFLKENERKISTLMSNLPGIAYRCLNDEGYTMQLLSKGCKELTGYSVSALVGNKDISYGELIHPDDQELVKNSVDAAVDEDEPFKIIYRIISKEEKIKWVWEQGRKIQSIENDSDFLEGFITDITQQKELEKEIKTLSGLLPLCSHCKKIRDDKGYWNQIESYISERSDVDFSHSICPDCLEQHYPDYIK